jgi:hypothetical protein
VDAHGAASSVGAAEEGGLDPIDEGTHVGEIDSGVGDGRPNGKRERGNGGEASGRGPEIRMRTSRATADGASYFAGRRVDRQAENVEVVVHDEPPLDSLPGAERDVQFAASIFFQSVEIDRAVALVTEHFNQSGTTLFLGRLQLTVSHAKQMHLQRLDEKILGIPTIRTRQRQMSTPSGVCHARQECIAFFRAAGPNSAGPGRSPMPASAGNPTRA